MLQSGQSPHLRADFQGWLTRPPGPQFLHLSNEMAGLDDFGPLLSLLDSTSFPVRAPGQEPSSGLVTHPAAWGAWEALLPQTWSCPPSVWEATPW